MWFVKLTQRCSLYFVTVDVFGFTLKDNRKHSHGMYSNYIALLLSSSGPVTLRIFIVLIAYYTQPSIVGGHNIFPVGSLRLGWEDLPL